jgi:hypothetical protein
MYYEDPIFDPENHKTSYPNEACFQASRVIECNGKTDTRKCSVCGKTWETKCNFDENFS